MCFTPSRGMRPRRGRKAPFGSSVRMRWSGLLRRSQFQGIGAGNFDPARFPGHDRQYGYTEHVLAEHGALVARQSRGHHRGRPRPAEALVDALTRFQNDQRSVSTSTRARRPGPSTRRARNRLAAYFDGHKTASFRAPEYRKLSFCRRVSPEESVQVSEGPPTRIAKRHVRQRRTDRHAPRNSEVQQIVFRTLSEAETERSRITSGTSFDDLASRNLNLADVYLG